jgi:hypothetical protein
MLIGWRYVAVKNVVLVDLTPSDGTGKIFLFDYLEYRGGPPWWPAALVYPLIGIGVGLLTAILLSGLWKLRTPSHRIRTATFWLAATVTGILVGIITAQMVSSSPPTIDAVAVTGSGHASDPDVTAKWPGVEGAPPTFDLVPPAVSSTALAIIAALAGAGAAQAVFRTRRAADPPRDTPDGPDAATGP